MDTSPIAKVHKLIALATNAAASEHEARTAALMACKLIAQHKLLTVTFTATPAPKPAPKPSNPAPKPAAAKPPAPKHKVKVMTALYGTWCGCCGDPIFKGDTISYYPKRKSAWHAACAGV